MSADGRKRSSKAGIAALTQKYGPDWARVIGARGSLNQSHETRVRAGHRAAETTRKRYGTELWERTGEEGKKHLPPPEVGFAAAEAKYGPYWRSVVAQDRVNDLSPKTVAKYRRMIAKARAAQTPEQKQAASVKGGRNKAVIYGHDHYVEIGRKGALARDLGKIKAGVSVEIACSVYHELPSRLGIPTTASALVDGVEERIGRRVAQRQIDRALAALAKLGRIEHVGELEGYRKR